MNAAGVVDDYLGVLLSGATAEPAPVAAPLRAVPAATVDVVAAPMPPAAAPAPATPPPAPAAPPVDTGHAATPPLSRPALPPRRLPPRGRAGEAQNSDAPAAPLRRANERNGRWLRLRCGDQVYGVELLKIREVVLPTPLLPLRGAVPSVAGIMNLRGQVVPVIDLGVQLGEPPIGESATTRVVVLEEGGDVLGLRVTAIEDVVLVADADVEGTHTSRLAPVGGHRIRGIARLNGAVMLLLDAARLLSATLHTPR
ncbi:MULTISPECIES: chemotaxis protein CheW [Luteimonas]|uniref:chemotaxis protein CheW n=1 Tax=Luteimonas TaxID=83614 RepID=UPI001180A8E7|nr:MULTISPECIES: chemotaxis protein CheW [Luteimonas]